MPQSSSDAFEIHERPTAQRERPDLNATTRIAKVDIESLVRGESGTRPVVTPDQIASYMAERTAEITGDAKPNEEEKKAKDEVPPPPESFRDRETLDAGSLPKSNAELVEGDTIQRHTLVMRPESGPQTTAQQIPIDVDLSRISSTSRAVEQVPLLDRVDRRQLTIAIAFAIAMVSALAGFIAGRASL